VSYFDEVSAQFAQDCAAGLWRWLPVTPPLVEAAAQAVRRLLDAARHFRLRGVGLEPL